jgi:hypothetical protein
MKSINLILAIAFFSAAISSSGEINAENFDIKVPKTVSFLDAAAGTQLRMVDGKFEARKDGKYSASNLPESLQKISVSGSSNEIILGAPATVDDYVLVDARKINNDNRTPTAAAFINGSIIAILENRVFVGSGVETHFAVFSRNGDFRKIAEFKLRENPYNLCLNNAYAVSSNLVAILLRSSRHPYINALVFFDISRSDAVGYREFSRIQYLPNQHSIWLAQEVPNCVNLMDAVRDAEQHAVIIPLFNGGKLNQAFSETDALEAVVYK